MRGLVCVRVRMRQVWCDCVVGLLFVYGNGSGSGNFIRCVTLPRLFTWYRVLYISPLISSKHLKTKV